MSPAAWAAVTALIGGASTCGAVWIRAASQERTVRRKLAAQRRAESAEAERVPKIYDYTGIRPRHSGTIPDRLERAETDIAFLKENDVILRKEINNVTVHQARDMLALTRGVEDLQRQKRRDRAETLYDLLALVLSVTLVQFLAALPGAAVPWLMVAATLYGLLALYRLLVLS